MTVTEKRQNLLEGPRFSLTRDRVDATLEEEELADRRFAAWQKAKADAAAPGPVTVTLEAEQVWALLDAIDDRAEGLEAAIQNGLDPEMDEWWEHDLVVLGETYTMLHDRVMGDV